MRIVPTQFNALVIALLLASAASAQVLTITSGGRRIIDRDPDSAVTNCLGWTYGPTPALGTRGELVGMYTTSDALTNHCRAGIGIDSNLRFGDAIRFHALFDGGAWSEGFNVIDRTRLSWMNDVAFLNANLQSFAGHVASPSVVFRDGRWYMAFAASLDDRNLCAGEHYAGNACGSCLDPWSYFVIVWAVSDDGVNWRVRERAPGDPTFLGRPPIAAERVPGSNYKGLTRVSLLAHGDDFYLVAQYWALNSIQIVMYRVPFDPSSEWGVSAAPEAVSTSLTGFLGSISRTRVFGEERFIALNPDVRGSGITYQTSTNLIDWTPPAAMRSAIPFFADGFGYDVSVIDPIAVDGADGKLHVFFASGDGDADHGIARDGRHDCGLYAEFGPTAVYLGTGIYEAIAEPLALRATRTTLASPTPGRYTVRVAALDGTVPQGNVVVRDLAGTFRIAPLVNGIASVDIPLTTAGDHLIQAWFDAQGTWDASRAPGIVQTVTFPRRRAVR